MPNVEDPWECWKALRLIIANSLVIWNEWLCSLTRNLANTTKEEGMGSLKTEQQTTIHCCCVCIMLPPLGPSQQKCTLQGIPKMDEPDIL
jgi:hypothetical protein